MTHDSPCGSFRLLERLDLLYLDTLIQNNLSHDLRQEGYVFTCVCLILLVGWLVGWFVGRIIQELLNGFPQKFLSLS